MAKPSSVFQSGLVDWQKATPGMSNLSGKGISEMRIDYGPGYRIYYIERMVRDIGKEVIILLCGADKTSQDSDIADAKKLARNLPEGLIEE
jgi:putative addiction module killer protein